MQSEYFALTTDFRGKQTDICWSDGYVQMRVKGVTH